MKKLFVVLTFVGCLAMTATQVQADERIWCEGIPNSSMNIMWGILYVDIGYGTWDLCSVREDRNGIHKETCQVIQKALLLAESEEKKVQFTFDVPSGTTCADLININGDWHAPDPLPHHMNFSK